MGFSDRGFGRIYVSGGSTAQTLHATPGTFNKIAAWASVGANAYGSVPTAGTTDSIDMTGSQPEISVVSWSISFTVSAAGLYRIAPYVNSVVLPGTEQRRTGATSTTYTLSGATAFRPSAANLVLDLRAASDQVSPDITISDGWLEFRQ